MHSPQFFTIFFTNYFLPFVIYLVLMKKPNNKEQITNKQNLFQLVEKFVKTQNLFFVKTCDEQLIMVYLQKLFVVLTFSCRMSAVTSFLSSISEELEEGSALVLAASKAAFLFGDCFFFLLLFLLELSFSSIIFSSSFSEADSASDLRA